MCIVLLLTSALVLTGCAQIAGSMQNCLDKCFEVCRAVRAGNVSLDGYSIGLEKESGGTTVKCSCSCGAIP